MLNSFFLKIADFSDVILFEAKRAVTSRETFRNVFSSKLSYRNQRCYFLD